MVVKDFTAGQLLVFTGCRNKEGVFVVSGELKGWEIGDLVEVKSISRMSEFPLGGKNLTKPLLSLDVLRLTEVEEIRARPLADFM